jgi:predicted metal-dependent hydrolase
MFEVEVIQTAVGSVRLLRSTRKTLAISVHPDGAVELVAPELADIADILKKVVKRTNWIRRQQRVFATMKAARIPRCYESGATHRYLGRQYRLKVSNGTPSGVRLVGGFFHVTVESQDQQEVKAALDVWMRDRAAEQFTRRVNQWREWCDKQGLPVPRTIIRAMQKRWGSAHKDGRIALNPKLVQAPSRCIDYVVTHEICHLKHPNHGAEFFRLLGQLMPDWQQVKLRLEQAEL